MSGARGVSGYAELGFWTRVSSSTAVGEERNLVEYFNGQFAARYDEMRVSGKVSQRFESIKRIIKEIDALYPNPRKDGVQDHQALLSFIRACQVGGDVFLELQKPYTWGERRRWTPYDKYTKRVEPLANEIIRANDASLVTPVTSPIRPERLFLTPATTEASPEVSATASPKASSVVNFNLGVIFLEDSGATSPVFTPSVTPLRTAQGG